MGLQIFKGQAKVKNAFCTGTDNHDRRMRQLLKIGGNIHGFGRTAVDTADPAGGKYFDAGHVRNDHGRGYGRGTVFPPCAEHSQIAAGGLGNGAAFFAEIFDLLGRKTGLQSAADHGNGGRDGAVIPNDLFDFEGRFNILRIRHTMRDDGAFQGNNRLPGADRFSDFGKNIQIRVHINLR